MSHLQMKGFRITRTGLRCFTALLIMDAYGEKILAFIKLNLFMAYLCYLSFRAVQTLVTAQRHRRSLAKSGEGQYLFLLLSLISFIKNNKGLRTSNEQLYQQSGKLCQQFMILHKPNTRSQHFHATGGLGTRKPRRSVEPTGAGKLTYRPTRSSLRIQMTSDC